MSDGGDEPRLGRWRLSTPRLRWLAIVLPIAFLALVDVLRHTLLFDELHTLPGYLATYAVLGVAVVIFTYTLFWLIAGLQARVNEQNRRLAAINAIVGAAAQQPRLEELLASGLDHVLRVMRAEAGLVCLADPERGEQVLVWQRGFTDDLAQRLRSARPRGAVLAGSDVRGGWPAVVEDALDGPGLGEAAARQDVRSAIGVPLHSGAGVQGLLLVASPDERHFAPADEGLLAAVGGQLGMAIRNAVLFERSERRNRDLVTLVTIGRAATSSLDLDELLGTSLETILQATSADAAEIWLKDESDLVRWGHRGAHPEAFLGLPCLAVGEGLPGTAAESRSTILVHDLASDPRLRRPELAAAGYHGLCAVPLRYQERVVGVLVVAALAPDALHRPADAYLLEAIGERLAAGIVNAELHRQVQQHAVLTERERIAREMHDGMAQVLAYLNTQTLVVKKLFADGRTADGNAELARMQESVQALYADVREGMVGLRTSSQAERSLAHALREYVERYRDMCGIDARFEACPQAEALHVPAAAELQLVRIVQEALANVRKHAEAASALVRLGRHGDDLCVEVVDDGRGFDPAGLSPTGWPRFGLQTMRERAEAVGGRFAVESSPGRGTRVAVRVPLAHGRNGEARR